MKINVYLTPEGVHEPDLHDQTVLLIDVLRTASNIITAFHNGAKLVVPAALLGDAARISANMDASILAGEKNGEPIDGYDLGNSPAEFTAEVVGGKRIILHTTNGTPAILKFKGAKSLAITGFLNLSAAASYALEQGNDISIICIGNKGCPTLEDTLCVGALLNILENHPNVEKASCDEAYMARLVYKTEHKNILKAMSKSVHGQSLIEKGFSSDLDYCSAQNMTSIVPLFDSDSSTIVARNN
jgi:2-phosphosulfolactate phosphatase